MALPLPNLDDRRWLDLVDEGRALIPLYAREWTDHNLHDPGITFMELFAWVTESAIYRVNRIPNEHLRRFLALVGVEPLAPRGSTAAVRLSTKGTSPVELPRGAELEGTDPHGAVVRFRTITGVSVVPATLHALQVSASGRDLTNLKDLLLRRESVAVLGDDPRPGAALYIGVALDSGAAWTGQQLSLYVKVEDGVAEDRARLVHETEERRRGCRAPRLGCPADSTPTKADGEPLRHHSAVLVWEMCVAPGRWRALEVRDETRALTLDGRVVFRAPSDWQPCGLGRVDSNLYYLRCRLAAGAFDAAPRLRSLLLNGVEVEQVVPVVSEWIVRADATVSGSPPGADTVVHLDVRFERKRPDEKDFDKSGRVTRVSFGMDDGPELRVREFQVPDGTKDGLLRVEAKTLTRGSGAPDQKLDLGEDLVSGDSLRLFTLEGEEWRRWERRPHFDASGPADAHFVLEVGQRRVRFGDGEQGRVVPDRAHVVVASDVTRGERGNLGPGKINRLADCPRNRALLAGPPTFEIEAPSPAVGGADEEAMDDAASRAFRLAENTPRAVTLADLESRAKDTPGTHVARVKAWANVHPAFPCFAAPGVVAVVILPKLPIDRPLPSRGLLRAVAAHLEKGRIVGTRIEVVGPTYVEVSVRARVRAREGISPAALSRRLRDALDRFLHPLTGGPNGEGWPFGRDVYRSEVLELLDRVEGADHVLFLEMVADGGAPSCGNLCVSPIGLVVSGKHSIEVLRGEA